MKNSSETFIPLYASSPGCEATVSPKGVGTELSLK